MQSDTSVQYQALLQHCCVRMLCIISYIVPHQLRWLVSLQLHAHALLLQVHILEAHIKVEDDCTTVQLLGFIDHMSAEFFTEDPQTPGVMPYWDGSCANQPPMIVQFTK